jgi:hypothetical protein
LLVWDQTPFWHDGHASCALRLAPFATIPIIEVTADLAEGARDLCRTARTDDFLEQPVARGTLFDALGAVLARSAEARIH